MPPPAVLKNIRVALIQGSKITEDRTLKKRVPVTVGTDERNTFVVPVSNLPPSFTLFELVNGAYSLVFTKEMDGRAQVNGADVSLQQAIEQGLAKPARRVLRAAAQRRLQGPRHAGRSVAVVPVRHPAPRAAQARAAATT